MNIFILFAEDNQYFAIDAQGEVVHSGIAEELKDSGYLSQAKSVIGIIPGEQVAIKRLELPIRQRSKLIQALPFALENDILGDIDEQHLSLVNWGNNKPVYVSITENATIEKYLEWAKEHEVRLNSLLPDFALYDIDEQTPYHLFSRDEESTIMVEDNYLRSVCDNDFLEHAVRSLVSSEEEFEVKRISVSSTAVARYIKAIPGLEYVVSEHGVNDLHEAIKLFAQRKDSDSPFELLTEEYAPPSAGFAKYSLFIAGALLAVLLLGKFGFDHWLSYKLNSEIAQLTDEAQNSVSEVFPDMRRFSSLSTLNFQLEQEIAKMRGNENVSNEFMFLLQQLTQGVQTNNVKLEQISYRNNALVFNAKVGQFSQLQNIENSLRSSGDLDVKLISSGNQGNEVNARYEIRLK